MSLRHSTLSASRVSRPPGFDRRWLALTVTTIGAFMSLLDSTIVNIALPSILKDFNSNLETGQLVLTVYLLALAVVIPVSGYFADRVGMKRMYILTLFFFTAGSALCGLAWNLPSLIVFRVLQGLGGGMLQPLGMAIVFSMITPLERGYFMGLLGLPMLLAPIIGPTVGGYLVEYSTWRMIFLINLPIGLINIGLAYFLLKDSPRKEGRLDRLGFVLAAIAFPAVLLALSQGESSGWTSPFVLTTGGVGIVALAAFVWAELHQSWPLLQIRLFANRTFSTAIVLSFVAQAALFGMSYVLPLFLQLARGLSPAKTGLVLFPSGIVSFITMNVGGRLYNRLGPRPLALSGFVILLVSSLMLSRISEQTNVFLIAILASARGAVGLCAMPVMTCAYNTVDPDQMPRATALVNGLFRVFGAITTALMTTALVVSLSWHGAPEGSSITDGTASINFMVEAFNDAFLLMALISLLGIILSLFIRDRVLEGLRDQHSLRQESIAGSEG